MKRFSIVLTILLLASGNLFCKAEPPCGDVAVRDSVEAEREELTLADVLVRGACPRLRAAAVRVSLGASPRVGSLRAIAGQRIRGLLEAITNEGSSLGKMRVEVPERVVVRRAGANKSCAEITRFLQSWSPSPGPDLNWQESLNCPAAKMVPEDASIELVKSGWNAGLRRWEFAMRCAEPVACVPFLIWTQTRKISSGQDTPERGALVSFRRTASASPGRDGTTDEPLVKRGQTATLTWDHGGIRVVLPVTCLDAGGLGQVVRVQLKNAARIMRAEVIGDRILRASL